MSHDTESDHLDVLLARSAPPAAAADADLTGAVASVIAQARVAPSVPRRLRWTRRSVALTAIGAAVVLTGGALAATSVSPAWMPWRPGTVTADNTVEWQVTWPDGTLCVNRLTAMDLSDEDLEATAHILRDPHTLLAEDDGKVRQLFLTEFAVQGVDMGSVLDLAYESVVVMDVDAGRGDLLEEDLGSVPATPEDEVFKFSHMRLVEDSLVGLLAEQGIDAEHKFTPDTACVVSP